MRHVIFHVHLFKNAGSSFDRILRDSFPVGWAEKEFKFTLKTNSYAEVKEWIEATPEIQAYSSHTALLPLPEIDKVEIFPVIFIRHPLVRQYSGYRYEVEQDAKTPGAIHAKKMNFDEYLLWRMGRRRDYSVRNFQALRLAHATRSYVENIRDQEAIMQHAMSCLNGLPFIGLVEEFEQSVETLAKLLARRGLQLKVSKSQENVNSDISVSTEKRIELIREELSETTFKKYLEINAVDLKVYNTVRTWYGK